MSSKNFAKGNRVECLEIKTREKKKRCIQMKHNHDQLRDVARFWMLGGIQSYWSVRSGVHGQKEKAYNGPARV